MRLTRSPRRHKRQFLCVCVYCKKEFHAARENAKYCDTDRCQAAKHYKNKNYQSQKEPCDDNSSP